MRLQNPDSIACKQFLLDIGDGKATNTTIEEIDNFITLADILWIPLDKNQLFNQIYDNFDLNFQSVKY